MPFSDRYVRILAQGIRTGRPSGPLMMGLLFSMPVQNENEIVRFDRVKGWQELADGLLMFAGSLAYQSDDGPAACIRCAGSVAVLGYQRTIRRGHQVCLSRLK